MMKYISVAIDGPSGAGKSTVARAAAAKLGYVYVDTGAMYRSIGLAVCRRGIAGEDTAGIIATLPEIAIQLTYQDGAQHVLLNGEDVSEAIRTPEISYYASKVSAVPEVRRFLLETQRNMAKNGNILMDGRDIGTVILPDAPVKIFLTASAQSRAERRYKELIEKGQQVTMDGILHDINERDRQDMTRAVAPLKQADDAALFGQRLQDRLADPPYGIRNKFEAARFVELLGGLDQSQIPLVDQVRQRQALVLVLFRNGNHEPKVGASQFFEGFLVALFDPLRQI